jgi:hypothetical protein
MNLFLYQAYYDVDQMKHLDPICIPYDNLANRNPTLREYPFIKNLYEIHSKNPDDCWGLLSWRWYDKTKLEMKEFRDWILANPGYDVYHLDPFLDVSATHLNLWTQGDIWVPGMIDFCDRLFPKLGIHADVRTLVYHPHDFATCNYHVGNNKFWKSFITFVDECLNIIESDAEMKFYMYDKKIPYNGAMLPGFIFVIERLFSIHTIFNRNIKIKKYPIESENYGRLYGDSHQFYVDLYNNKVLQYEKHVKKELGDSDDTKS